MSAAAAMNDSATSTATTRAPWPASSRVLWPSPQPRSRQVSPSTGGRSAKNPGVLTRSRYRSNPARDISVQATAFAFHCPRMSGCSTAPCSHGAADCRNRKSRRGPLRTAPAKRAVLEHGLRIATLRAATDCVVAATAAGNVDLDRLRELERLHHREDAGG